MDSLLLLGLILIIVFIFAVSRCSLNCPCDSEKFNDHPVLRKNRRYQHIMPPISKQVSDTNINTKASCDGSDCKCVLCDDPSPGKCVSRTCKDISAATNCCNSQDVTCPNCNAQNDSTCDYQTWCDVSFDDKTGNGIGGSEEMWIIITVSVLAAIFFGVVFYFWMTTKHSG
jgi:hypothetical protein